MARGIAAIQPTKAKTRRSLQAVKDAAHTLIDALNDGALRGFLDEAPDEIPITDRWITCCATLRDALKKAQLCSRTRMAGWRRHFEQAKAPALSEDRAEFRRHLKEGRYHAEMLAGNK
jgi:hypothetical protein